MNIKNALVVFIVVAVLTLILLVSASCYYATCEFRAYSGSSISAMLPVLVAILIALPRKD